MQKMYIQESKKELQAIQNAIHEKLTNRTKLREEKVSVFGQVAT